MVDTPTTNYQLRQQGLGTNTNTWGDDKLNEVLRDIDQILGTIKTITLTGDYTITSTNYVTTADNKNCGFRFNGSLTSAATITVPALKVAYFMRNTCGASLAIKTSSGSGITLPNGRQAWVYCDGVDVFSATANYIPTATTLANDQDIVSNLQLMTAIANAVIPAASGAVRNSSSDTTAGFLSQKIAVTGSLTATTLNPGANEQLQISFTLDEGQTALYAGVFAL